MVFLRSFLPHTEVLKHAFLILHDWPFIEKLMKLSETPSLSSLVLYIDALLSNDHLLSQQTEIDQKQIHLRELRTIKVSNLDLIMHVYNQRVKVVFKISLTNPILHELV